jgi:hypothetical protein
MITQSRIRPVIVQQLLPLVTGAAPQTVRKA